MPVSNITVSFSVELMHVSSIFRQPYILNDNTELHLLTDY